MNNRGLIEHLANMGGTSAPFAPHKNHPDEVPHSVLTVQAKGSIPFTQVALYGEDFVDAHFPLNEDYTLLEIANDSLWYTASLELFPFNDRVSSGVRYAGKGGEYAIELHVNAYGDSSTSEAYDENCSDEDPDDVVLLWLPIENEGALFVVWGTLRDLQALVPVEIDLERTGEFDGVVLGHG